MRDQMLLAQIKFVISAHTEEEKKASSALITECFDKAMGIAYENRYDWQFLENPAGIGSILMAYDGEKLIGQIASIPCRYTFMDNHFLTAISGEWLCVSPQYRGKGIMSELIHRRTRTDDNPFPFVLDMPNEASMNGFLKANCHQMSLKLLVRPLKLSKCFVYKKLPRIVLRPFDGIWEKRRWRRAGLKLANLFLMKIHHPLFDARFDKLFNATDNKAKIRQVRTQSF